mgnify:CR=1 FL=1
MIPSLYKKVSALKETEQKCICLMQRKTDQSFFVQRKLKQGDYFVYKTLQEKQIEGIPKIYDVQIQDEWLIIQEEFIQASTLDELLPFDSREAVKILC